MWTRVVSERSRRPGPVVAALVLALLVGPVHAAAAQSDAEAERDGVRQQRDAAAAELDVLEASDVEIDAELDRLERAIADQQDALADAEAASDVARQAVVDAERALRVARGDVHRLERAIVEMAVASYVNPPTADFVQSLQATSFSDALLQRAYLDARARRDLDLLDLLEVAEATAASRAKGVEAAAADAADAVGAAGAALTALRDEQAAQQAFATDLQSRIDASLAEAAALAEVDAELAAQIQAEQAVLIARIPPPPPTPLPASAETPPAAPRPTPSTPSAPGPTTGARPTTTTTRPTATTRPPSTVPPDVEPPPIDTSTPPLRTVRGITVHADIAADLEALLAAAEADGVELSGSGYRSTARQVELRRVNCGPSDWDIWYRPASTCSPPTAVPGRSLHEKGRAIDFTAGGRAITSRSSDAFRWLADDAASFGFFNLPSEPWHWSTTGA